MKKVIKLTEKDLSRVIEKVIKEGSNKNRKVSRPKRRNLKEEEDDYVDVSSLYQGDELKVCEETNIYVLDGHDRAYMFKSEISPDYGVFNFVLEVYEGILCIMDGKFFIIHENDFHCLRYA
jgi:hypothetical protein